MTKEENKTLRDLIDDYSTALASHWAEVERDSFYASDMSDVEKAETKMLTFIDSLTKE